MSQTEVAQRCSRWRLDARHDGSRSGPDGISRHLPGLPKLSCFVTESDSSMGAGRAIFVLALSRPPDEVSPQAQSRVIGAAVNARSCMKCRNERVVRAHIYASADILAHGRINLISGYRRLYLSFSRKPDRCSYVCQGGLRHFPVSFLGSEKDGELTVCWMADKTGKVHSGEGKLLSGHAQQVRNGAGDGRRIVRRPAGSRQPNIGSGRPRGIGVSRRQGAGAGRPGGRRSA
jgi:hypothetical protein